MTIEVGTRSNLDEVVDFLFWANNEPDQYCGYCSTNQTIINNDLKQGLENKTDLIVVSRHEGKINGVMTGHIDKDNQAVDCCGPFMNEFNMGLAEAMFDALKTRVSKPLSLNFFFSDKHIVCRHLMDKYKGINQGSEKIMHLTREQYYSRNQSPVTSTYLDILPLDKKQYQSFIRLHDDIFPDSYINGQGIVSSIGSSRKVYVIEESEVIRGYGVLRFSDSVDATSIAAEIIAVRKEDRGQGYGKRIVSKMLSEAFQNKSISSIELVVEEDNLNAIRLYEKLGFSVKAVNLSYLYRGYCPTLTKRTDK